MSMYEYDKLNPLDLLCVRVHVRACVCTCVILRACMLLRACVLLVCVCVRDIACVRVIGVCACVLLVCA